MKSSVSFGGPEPERGGLELLLRELDVLVAEDLVGVVLDPLESEHLRRNDDLAEEDLHPPRRALRVGVQDAGLGVVAGLRVVGSVGYWKRRRCETPCRVL